jgi:uncharacterized membrane protein
VNLFETICFGIIIGFCLITTLTVAIERKHRKTHHADLERLEKAINIIHEAAETDDLEQYLNAINFVNRMLKEKM